MVQGSVSGKREHMVEWISFVRIALCTNVIWVFEVRVFACVLSWGSGFHGRAANTKRPNAVIFRVNRNLSRARNSITTPPPIHAPHLIALLHSKMQCLAFDAPLTCRAAANGRSRGTPTLSLRYSKQSCTCKGNGHKKISAETRFHSLHMYETSVTCILDL